MTPLVTLPFPLTDGTTAKGSEVRANDDALKAVLNGGIEDVNVKTGAAIDGNKLSNIPGAQIPFDRIADDAVTADKLRDDATVDGQRAVTTNHIRDQAVTKGKVSTAGGSRLTVAQLELATGSGAIPASGSVAFVSGGVVNINAFLGICVTPVNVAGSWRFSVIASWARASDENIYAFSTTVDPNAIGIGTLPVATKQILACWLQSPSVAEPAVQLNGTLYVVYIATT
jgi:hypothetical protein